VAALLCLSLSGCVLISGNFNLFRAETEPLEEHVVFGEDGAKILLMEISRVIGSQQEDEAFGVTHRESVLSRVRAELERAAEDDDVRALVVRINSPGGTVTASDVIFDQLMRFKEKRGVPVVAHLLDIATSGAYYVALAADEVIASPTTVTGSIGVIMYGLNFSGLMTKLGVADQTIKTGARKDIGSPLREMTPEERKLLEGVLGQMQQRFVSVVRERRPKIADDTMRTITDGRILGAAEALEAGLVDRIGYLEDAIDAATRRAGVEEAQVVMYRRSNEYAESIYSRAAPGQMQFNLFNLDAGGLAAHGPRFMYLWLPGAP
jgi:protease-4